MQLKTAPRLKIFKTKKQPVEKMPPLREEVSDFIPKYTKLNDEDRAKWRCNKCLRKVYPSLRTMYIGLWFYYIPFLAMTVSFIIPFLAEKLSGIT